MSISIIPPESPSADVDELVGLVDELERAQRAEDVQGFLELFDHDAVWVSAGGVRLIGRDAIAAFTPTVLPGAFSDGSVKYEVEHIRLITPDVALTGVNQEYLTADGGSLVPPQQGRPSYLWRRAEGRWLIAGAQNTAVPV